MIVESVEVGPQNKESLYWGTREELTVDEQLEVRGLEAMESLVAERGVEPLNNFQIDYLATDMYEEITKPFGFPSRSYRQDNYSITGGNIEYPDYHLISRRMKGIGSEAIELLREAEKTPDDVGKVIAAAALMHRVVYVHPFRDFNGRISRGLVHYALRRLGYQLPDWQFSGRNGYLDAVADGNEDQHKFEAFLSKAMLSSYKKIGQDFDQVHANELGEDALKIRRVTSQLQEYA